MRGPDRMRCVIAVSVLWLASCRGTPSARPPTVPASPPASAPSPTPGGSPPGAPAERGEVSVSALGAGAGRADRAVRRYAGDHAGRLPSSLEALLREPDLDGAPYLRDLPRDAWGRPLSYAVLSARYGVYELRSFGPDGAPATGDDLIAKPEAVPFD